MMKIKIFQGYLNKNILFVEKTCLEKCIVRYKIFTCATCLLLILTRRGFLEILMIDDNLALFACML